LVAQSTDESVFITEQVKTDLVRGKKTLPVVLAVQSGCDLHSIGSDEEKRTTNRQALQEGIMTARGICLLYRERAHDQLQKIEAQQSISHVLHLLLGFA
jgi:geranylgeranyl pyrophosphate synthase